MITISLILQNSNVNHFSIANKLPLSNNSRVVIKKNKIVSKKINKHKKIKKTKLISYKNNLYMYGVLGINYKGYDLYTDFDVDKDVIERDLVDKYNVCCKHVQKKFIGNIKLLETYTYKKNICVNKNNKNYCNYYYELKGKNINKNNLKGIIIFLHGAIYEKDNAFLGFNDYNFGGNFNRLKNLSLLNNYIYLSIDFQDFRYIGPIQLNEIIKKYQRNYKNNISFIILAGSSGGELLSNYLIKYFDKNTTNLSKIVLEGSLLQGINTILNKLNHNTKFYVIHGEKDSNISYEGMSNIIKIIKKHGFKIKSILVKGGFHGTPIRKIDYFDMLKY